jgi:outer membrane protein assembly factor BamA
MTKLSQPISILLFIVAIFLCSTANAQDKYDLIIRAADKDSAFLGTIALQDKFSSRAACVEYVNKLPSILQSRGYATASLDSLHYDSASAQVVIFFGEAYHWAEISTDQVDPSLLTAVDWKAKNFPGKPMDFNQVQTWQEKILNYLENNGHPFAKVYLDSVQVGPNNQVYAVLKVEQGPVYKIDSVRVYGNAKISNNFLQRYLDISNGTIYSKQKLQIISRRIAELGYVEEEKPSDISMVPTGAVLNLYLKPKRSSQVNLLFGFLPNSDQLSDKKLLITGEGNLNLKNALGAGETIGFSYQKLQVRSQRLNLLYQHPYIFNSPVGFDFAFDMYRGDSVYLNVNLQFGASFVLSSTQTGKLYFQHFTSIANGINTDDVLESHQLPEAADVSTFSVGIDDNFNTTDYNRNPRRGNQFYISTMVGTKKIKKNDQILALEDPSDPSFNFETLYDTVKLKTYQLKIKAINIFPLENKERSKPPPMPPSSKAQTFSKMNCFR